jgi:copper(I)-binding protein
MALFAWIRELPSAMRPFLVPRRCRQLACAALAAMLVTQAHAVFIVSLPWVLPVARGGSTEVYMDLTSTDGATLVAAASEAAGSASILGPGKTAKTAQSVPLPAGTLVELRPAAYRIRLQGMARSLKLGDHVRLTLTIRGADGAQQEIPVTAEVRHHSALEDHRAQQRSH